MISNEQLYLSVIEYVLYLLTCRALEAKYTVFKGKKNLQETLQSLKNNNKCPLSIFWVMMSMIVLI